MPCGIIVAPTTSDDVRSGSNDKHVTASHGVTARHGKSRCHSTSRKLGDVTGYQSRAEQNPLTPTWDAPALKRPFLGISKCLHSCSQQHALDERIGDVGRMAQDGRPLVFGLQDLAKVHEMPFRGGSRGTAGASPDANGRLDNRIPTDSRLSIFPDTGKTGTHGENLSYTPSRERKDYYHVGNERGSVSEQRRLADSRPPVHP